MAKKSLWKIPRAKTDLGIGAKVRRKLGKKVKSSSKKYRDTYMDFYNDLDKVKRAKKKYARAHAKPTKKRKAKKPKCPKRKRHRRKFDPTPVTLPFIGTKTQLRQVLG